MTEAEQPELFEAEELTQGAALDAVMRRPVDAFTGDRVRRCQALVDEVVDCLGRDHSERLIAARYKVSRNSVRRIREWAEAAGRLEPARDRIRRRLGHLVESSLEYLQETIDARTLPVDRLASAVSTLCDKYALALGQPTSIVGRARPAADPDAIEAELAPLLAIEATVVPAPDEQSGAGSTPAGGREAPGAEPVPFCSATPPQPAAADPLRAAPAASEVAGLEGGGGSRQGRPAGGNERVASGEI